MTSEQLEQLGIGVKLWLDPLNAVFEKYNINTPLRQAAFIGQCQHESGNFKSLEENLYYSADGLMRTWPSRFPTIDVAEKYANNPKAIANKVYAGRLGNSEEGDGWAYHGRGLIQITGRDLYSSLTHATGVDYISNPELLIQTKHASSSAGWYWNKKGLNDLADEKDYETMTKRINGGLIGLNERKLRILKAISVLG